MFYMYFLVAFRLLETMRTVPLATFGTLALLFTKY